MKKIVKSEVLAPAGDYEKAVTAFDYGADAVFLGAKAYSLRSQASNFFMKDIKATCDYAHKHNKKVYVAVNVICHNALLKGLEKFMKELVATGVDALIVADPYIIDFVSTHYPKLELHLSTQQSVTNSAAARFWKKNKVSRVVLAREVSIKELELLMHNLNNEVEIEYFIHGAVCISFSGRCMMSNNWSLRDANVGGCAQSCRWRFELTNEKQTKKYTNQFTMSPKDMMLVNDIQTLMKLGVASFKIEGRMRSLNYVATVTKAYRQAVDLHYSNKKQTTLQAIKKDLKYAENRLTGSAFSKGDPKIKEMLYHEHERKLKQKFIFIVHKKQNNWIIVNSRNLFKKNQKISIFGPNDKYDDLKITKIKDKHQNEIDVANKPMDTYYVQLNKPIKNLKKGYIGRLQ